MDTLTHALSGALVARVLHRRDPRPAPLHVTPTHGRPALPLWQAVLAGTLAGAFPDIDSLTELIGQMAYLRHHRGVTHSLLMAPLWALLLALLLRWAFAATRGPGGWKALYPVLLAAILIHIAGDWITQFGTMLLAPLSDARFGLGSIFIIDLALSGIVLAGLTAAAVFPTRRAPAVAALMLAVGWVALATVGKHEAEAAGWAHARQQGIAAQWVDTMPRPASPFNWTVTVFDGEGYHVAHVNTRRAAPLVATAEDHFVRRFSAPYQPLAQATWQAVPRFGGPEAPAWVRELWQHEALATYRWFAVAPALAQATEQPAADGRGVERCAVFRDLRFEFPGRGEPPFRYGVCVREGDDNARLVRLQQGRQEPAV